MADPKILIVDDDRDVRTGLNVRLRACGYRTVFASDGAGAIATARSERPDLILLDIGLPGADGFVVLQRLRKDAEVAQIPVIVLTARDAAANEPRALERGAVGFFQKPADNEQLLEAIAQQLR